MPPALLQHLKVVRWHAHSCDLLPVNGSKAVGIDAVLRKLGLSKDNIIVFGEL